MFIGITIFLLSWISFFIFADKKRFANIVPTCYVAVILAFSTDLLMFIYPLWEYPGSKIELFWIQFTNSFGIYFVVTYLFLQTLPKKQTVFTVTLHIFAWSLFAIILEWVLLQVGFIKHGLWWNLGCSYASDWILFFIFYLHHRWIKKYMYSPSATT